MGMSYRWTWLLVDSLIKRWRRTGLRAETWFALAAGAAMLVGAGLRVYRLEYQSLWADEIFSLLTTHPALTFHEFWGRVLADTHPPLYYLILRLWSTYFGQSAIAARVPSAFFGLLTLCVGAILSSFLARISRVTFLLLLAVSPGGVWYAREARSYSLLLLMSTVVTLACARSLHCNDQNTHTRTAAIAVMTAAGLVASFTHYFGFLVAAASFVTCFVLTTGRNRVIVTASGCASLACFIPWVIYHSQTVDLRLTRWIGQLSILTSLHWFEQLSFGGAASLGLFAIVGVTLIIAADWRDLVSRNTTIWSSGLLCLLTLAFASAISLYVPILTARNMIMILPALYLTVAEMTRYLVGSWGKVAGAAYLATQVGLMGQPLVAYYTTDINEQWRDSAAYVLKFTACRFGTIYVNRNPQYYRFALHEMRPHLHFVEVSEGAKINAGDAQAATCPILLWAIGPEPWEADQFLAGLGLSRSSLSVIEYHKAIVVLRNGP